MSKKRGAYNVLFFVALPSLCLYFFWNHLLTAMVVVQGQARYEAVRHTRARVAPSPTLGANTNPKAACTRICVWPWIRHVLRRPQQFWRLLSLNHHHRPLSFSNSGSSFSNPGNDVH
ncbi:hypothetical protein PM082_020816 [Marasmius tenuissimus]|nr:hypothetical protein PM082_020816 [Marasmius tenuissimus]